MKEPFAAVLLKIATVSVPTVNFSVSPVVVIATGSSCGKTSEPETAADSSPRSLTSLTDHATVEPGAMPSLTNEKESPCASQVAIVSSAPPIVRTADEDAAPSPGQPATPEKAAVVADVTSPVAETRIGAASPALSNRTIRVPEPPRPP